jgi:hypothetical protein
MKGALAYAPMNRALEQTPQLELRHERTAFPIENYI